MIAHKIKHLIVVLLIFPIISLAAVSCTKSGYLIEGEVVGLQKGTLYLSSYYGSKLDKIDSVNFSGGKFKIYLPEDALPGMYRIYWNNNIPEGIDFIFNKENFRFKTHKDSLLSALQILESEENELLYSFLPLKLAIDQFMSLGDRLNREDPFNNKPALIEINNYIDSLEFRAYKLLAEIDENSKNKLSYKVLKAGFYPNYEIHLQMGGNEYSNAYEFMQKHFFDNLDFNEANLIRTPIIYMMVNEYLQMYVEHQTKESYIKASNFIISKAAVNDEVYDYVSSLLLKTFETSDFWEVYVYLMETYFSDVCYDENTQYADKQKLYLTVKNSIPGNKAQNFGALNINGNTASLYEHKATAILLFFWSPDCPYCAQQIEFLKMANEKYKDKDIKIIAFALTDSKKEWQESVNSYKINNWINISDLKGMDSDVFEKIHIRGTPELYLLSKDFVIESRPQNAQMLEDAIKKLVN